MDNNLAEIFNILNGARAILLLPSAYPAREEVIGLVMLAHTLEHNQKAVTLLVPSVLTSSFPPALPWPKGLKQELLAPEEVTIALDTERHRVRALRYQQEEGLLRIYIRADQPLPQTEDFIISTAEGERFEATVVLGAPSIDLIPKRSELEPTLTRGTLINIDADPTNEGFGDLNLLTDTEPLSTTVERLTQLFPLASPDLEQWETALTTPALGLPGLHMLGRMLARLTEERGIWTSTLTDNDFEQSGLSREAFGGVLPLLPLGQAFFPKPYGVLWGLAGTIQSSFVGADKRFYARLNQRMPGTYGFEGYHSSIETENIEHARMRIIELLS